MKQKTKMILVFSGATAISVLGLYLLYDYISNQDNSIVSQIKNNTNNTNQNLNAVSSATGSNLGYLQNEVNGLQAEQMLNQTNPDITFGSLQGSKISAPTGSSFNINNQAPNYNTNINNEGTNIKNSGNPNANSVKIPQLPSYSAGASL